MLKHPHEQQFYTATKSFKNLIRYDYLTKLDCCTLASKCIKDDCIQLIKINTFTSSETFSYFTYVFDALATTHPIMGFILHKTHNNLNFYIALKTHANLDVATHIFYQGFLSTFPDSKLQVLNKIASCELLTQLFSPEHYSAITSVTTIPNNTTCTPILEKLTSLLYSEVYTALFLVEPVSPNDYKDLLKELFNLYNTLSQFTQSTNTLSKSVSHNTSCTHTVNQSESCSNSCTCTDSCSTSCSKATYNNISPSTTAHIPKSNRSINISTTFNNAISNSDNQSNSTAKGENNSCSQGNSEANLKATNLADSNSFSYCSQNKIACDMTTLLNSLLTRLESATTLFHFTTYFLAPLQATTIRAAYTYNGLANDLSIATSPNFIYTWTNSDPCYLSLIECFQNLTPTLFKSPYHPKPFTPSVAITSSELLNTFYFPFSCNI